MPIGLGYGNCFSKKSKVNREICFQRRLFSDQKQTDLH